MVIRTVQFLYRIATVSFFTLAGIMSRTVIRQRILQDCSVLFNQRCYTDVPIPEAEQASGLTKAVLYGYFENRQKMALDVLDHNLKQKRETINRYAGTFQSISEKLLAHIKIHHPQQNKQLIAGGCPIWNAAIVAGEKNEEMRQLVADALLAWQHDLAGLVQAGINLGEFKATIKTDEIALQIISLIESALVMERTLCNTNVSALLLNQAAKIVADLKVCR